MKCLLTECECNFSVIHLKEPILSPKIFYRLINNYNCRNKPSVIPVSINNLAKNILVVSNKYTDPLQKLGVLLK